MTAIVPSNARVFVAGHRGLVGSAIVRALKARGFSEILTAPRDLMDLRNQSQVNQWFAEVRPEFVYLVAGTVGGILANATRPAEFLYDNLMIHANVIEASRHHGVRKLLYLGSSCIYPRESPQPIPESALLSGALEQTNEAYALAKITGIKMCQTYRRQYGSNFISAMPTNLYGPNDNFDLQSSHVLPAMIRKFHEAKVRSQPRVEIWGSGSPRREFLHVDDLADCCLFLMDNFDGDEHINVGTGEDISIQELACLVAEEVFSEAEIEFDRSKPDGTPRKLLDVSALAESGWRNKTPLRQGIRDTYKWFLSNSADR